MKIKTHILLLTLLVFASSSVFPFNFVTVGGATSSASKTGAVIEDTVGGSANGLMLHEFSFIYRNVNGGANKDISVKVQSAKSSSTGSSQAGLLIRENLSASSSYLAVYVDGKNQLKIEEKWPSGFVSIRASQYINRSERIWLRIEKKGQLCPIYYKYSKNGSWIWVDNGVFMPTGDPYQAGVFSATGETGVTGIFEFRRLRLDNPMARIESERGALNIFPNPTNSTLNLGYTAENVSLYDMTGKLVIRSSRTNRLNLSDIPKGVYVIRADGYVGRVVKVD